MSADLLAEAEALLEAATPGPWRASEYGFVEAGADTICQFWDKYEEDFPHRQANAALIAHENLQVSNMVQSNLARSISDVGWGAFLNILALKAESAARRVIAVDPRYTSQRCHACGHTGKENRVNQASFRCVKCGHAANADHNAAKNILGRAAPSGVNGSGVSHAVA